MAVDLHQMVVAQNVAATARTVCLQRLLVGLAVTREEGFAGVRKAHLLKPAQQRQLQIDLAIVDPGVELFK